MKTFVSLGMSCQTTHQISHFAEQNQQQAGVAKSPFDWLICPPDSAASWLLNNLENFRPGDIITHRQRAWWPAHRLWFWHGFMDRSVNPPVMDLSGRAEQELSKLAYLRTGFRSLDFSSTIFIVSNTQNNLESEVFHRGETAQFHFSKEKIDCVQSALDSFFGSQVNLQVITRADRVSSQLAGQSNVHVLPADNSNWKGSKLDWGTVLHKLAE